MGRAAEDITVNPKAFRFFQHPGMAWLMELVLHTCVLSVMNQQSLDLCCPTCSSTGAPSVAKEWNSKFYKLALSSVIGKILSKVGMEQLYKI